MVSNAKNINTINIFITSFLLLFLFINVRGDLSANVYFIVFFISFIAAYYADINYSTNKSLMISILLVVFLGIFVGLRDFGIGIDTNVYIESYFRDALYLRKQEDLLNSNGDIGFLLLAWISRLFSDDPQALLCVTAFYIISFTIWGFSELNKYRQTSFAIFIFVYIFSCLNASMNLMRQHCAMAMLLLGFAYLIQGKWKKYAIIQFFAYFFHSSSVLFLFVPLIYYASSWKNVKMRYILSLVGLFILAIVIIQLFTYLPLFASWGLTSDIYAERYGVGTKYESMNLFGPAFIMMLCVVYYSVYLMYKKSLFTERETYIILMIHSLYFVLRLSSLSVGFLSRLSEYFFYVDMWYFTLILSYKKTPLYLKLLLILYILYIWYGGYIIQNNAHTYPYHSQILGI